MAKRTILVVEDDHAIRRGIVDALSFDGYATLESADGNLGLDMALRSNYELMLLDLALPGRDGLEILEELRRARPTVPVIILTARGAEADRVRGLQLGADDYVVKPFSVRELLARIEAVLRRSAERPLDVDEIALDGGRVDFARCEIKYDDGERHELSSREVDLLRYLATNSGRAISRDELLTRVWRLNPRHVETRTIDVHVARLRVKLRDDSQEPRILFTVRGKGYMFKVPEPSP